MNNDQKKLIIFKRDLENNEVLGEVCYVKFLGSDETYAIFYKPLIAPKYLKEYIKQNKIEVAYEILSDEVLEKYENKVYTFKSEGGVYKVKKGIEQENKLVLLVDYGMEISLNLPRYSYDIKGKTINLKPYKNSNTKGYCYVANDGDVNNELRKIMIPVLEIIPGLLFLDTSLDFCNDKEKKLKHT